ncbi:MAG: hypothetical protein JW882_11540 [Deltaproteobacteria bacterium]|nr:hypothetical protein [Deltaproteobacteria bacterium]
MATIMPEGENIKKALKWISGELQEDEGKTILCLIQAAALRFNLSPKDEEFLCYFYKEKK